jgi:hypothetical protein
MNHNRRFTSLIGRHPNGGVTFFVMLIVPTSEKKFSRFPRRIYLILFVLAGRIQPELTVA